MGITGGPSEFIDGIGAGFRSLTTSVVGGTASALGRIGQHIGTGVAALSMDEQVSFYLKMRQNNNSKLKSLSDVDEKTSADRRHFLRAEELPCTALPAD